MLKAIRMMSILVAANAEAVVLIFLAWWAGKKLNVVYPLNGVSWLPISFGVAIVLVSYSWFIILRPMFKEMSQQANKKPD